MLCPVLEQEYRDREQISVLWVTQPSCLRCPSARHAGSPSSRAWATRLQTHSVIESTCIGPSTDTGRFPPFTVSMHSVRGGQSHHQMQRMPRGLLHLAEALRACAHPRLDPAAAALRSSNQQLLPSPAPALSHYHAAGLVTERRRPSLRSSALPLAVSLHDEPVAASAPSVTATGAHTVTPPEGLDVGGPQDDAPHTPVLLREVLGFFAELQLRTLVDGTLGAGGHASALLAAHPGMQQFVGIDQDPTAHSIAMPRLRAAVAQAGSSTQLLQHHGNFSQIGDAVTETLGSGCGVDGILLDVGLSSMQVDSADRGFSFQRDGPLDMRMSPTAAVDAASIVNSWPEAELGRIFREYGEERGWRRIAARIAEAREQFAIRTTNQLVAAIGGGDPKARRSVRGRRPIHPATRVFQALRIAVNDELGALQRALPAAIDCLAPGGRLAVISFHSLEDRIVKRAFLAAAGRPPDDGDSFTAEQPEPPEPLVKILTRRPVTAGPDEEAANPRSRSAKLRVVEKLSAT